MKGLGTQPQKRDQGVTEGAAWKWLAGKPGLVALWDTEQQPGRGRE